MPCIDAIAAKGKDGQTLVAITNIDANNPVTIDLGLTGYQVSTVKAETLFAPAINAINTFGEPNTVMPRVINAGVKNNRLSLTLQPQSVTVLTITTKKN